MRVWIWKGKPLQNGSGQSTSKAKSPWQRPEYLWPRDHEARADDVDAGKVSADELSQVLVLPLSSPCCLFLLSISLHLPSPSFHKAKVFLYPQYGHIRLVMIGTGQWQVARLGCRQYVFLPWGQQAAGKVSINNCQSDFVKDNEFTPAPSNSGFQLCGRRLATWRMRLICSWCRSANLAYPPVHSHQLKGNHSTVHESLVDKPDKM